MKMTFLKDVKPPKIVRANRIWIFILEFIIKIFNL